MHGDKQQCGFCEAAATVWVSFVTAEGVVYKTGLCAQHADWAGVFDPKSCALVEGWGLAPEPVAAPAKDAGNLPDGMLQTIEDAVLKAAFDAISKGADLASGEHFKSVSVQLQGHVPGLGGHLPALGAKPAGGTGLCCPHCGLTVAAWKETGRLGCAHCYETFRRQIAASLPQLHGGRRDHWGKVPAGVLQRPQALEHRIALWQQRLERAVKSEAYEQAAQARDSIRELETELRR